MDTHRTGQLIAARRKELGLTQKQLAGQLNVSDRAVSKWERGAGFPDIALLEPLADALGLTVLSLLTARRTSLSRLTTPCASWSAPSTARPGAA